MKKICLLLLSCATIVGGAGAHDSKKPESHKVVVQEVIQTKNYTYLHVTEAARTNWLAVPSMEATAGEVYYYTGPMPMPNFESKELHRTFDTVLFLGGVSREPITEESLKKNANPNAGADNKPYKRTVPSETRKKIKIEPVAGSISISELLANKDKYAGKTITLRGEVTKFNPQIMNKNWIHLQDGTENNGKFDLVLTSDKDVKVGETVTLQGKVVLNKDFGYGYAFEVMVEDATIK